MNTADKLQWARLLTLAGLLLVVVLLLLVAENTSTQWLADMERELSVSLEVASNNLAGK